ncbi:MAG: hypothetical protein WCV68_04595 [Candidatus Paceibacterota bacterium]
MKNYKFGARLLLSLLFLGVVLIVGLAQAATVSPTISNITLNGSATRVNAPAGSELLINFSYSNFSSTNKAVSIRICRPGSSNCASYSNFSTTEIAPADIFYIGDGPTSGREGTTKMIGPRIYDRLVALDPAITPFFDMTEKKSYLRICPINSSGTIPSGSTCAYSPYFLVKPSAPITPVSYPEINSASLSGVSEWLPGASKAINFNYKNLTNQNNTINVKLCHPVNTSNCVGFASYYPLTGDGNYSITKTLNSQLYSDLVANQGYYVPYFAKSSSLGHYYSGSTNPYESLLRVCPAVSFSETLPTGGICAPDVPFYTDAGAGDTVPSINNILYHDSSGYGGDWQAGAAKTIYWDYSYFSSTVKRVSLSLCHPTDNNKCASWTNAPQTTISSADIVSSGGGAVGGQASTVKSTGANWYELASGTGSLAGFFSNRTARLKVCPVNDNGATPAGALCSYGQVFSLKAPTVTPTISATVAPNSVQLLAGSPGSYTSLVRVTWSPSNLPSGSTCNGNSFGFDDYYVSGWVAGGALNNSGYKDVKFSKKGTYPFVVTCKTPTSQSYSSNSATVTVGEIVPVTSPTVSSVGIYRGAAVDTNWAAGDTRTIKWSYTGFSQSFNTVSLSVCNPDNHNVCISWNTADAQFKSIPSGGGSAVGISSKNVASGPRVYDRLTAGDTTLTPYYKDYQAVIKICPTASMNGAGVPIGASPANAVCAYSPVFKITNPNDSNSPTFGLPSGQGCFVGECVCVNGVTKICGNPMRPGGSCTIANCVRDTVSVSSRLMASLSALSGWLLNFLPGFLK